MATTPDISYQPVVRFVQLRGPQAADPATLLRTSFPLPYAATEVQQALAEAKNTSNTSTDRRAAMRAAAYAHQQQDSRFLGSRAAIAAVAGSLLAFGEWLGANVHKIESASIANQLNLVNPAERESDIQQQILDTLYTTLVLEGSAEITQACMQVLRAARFCTAYLDEGLSELADIRLLAGAVPVLPETLFPVPVGESASAPESATETNLALASLLEEHAALQAAIGELSLDISARDELARMADPAPMYIPAFDGEGNLIPPTEDDLPQILPPANRMTAADLGGYSEATRAVLAANKTLTPPPFREFCRKLMKTNEKQICTYSLN